MIGLPNSWYFNIKTLCFPILRYIASKFKLPLGKLCKNAAVNLYCGEQKNVIVIDFALINTLRLRIIVQRTTVSLPLLEEFTEVFHIV